MNNRRIKRIDKLPNRKWIVFPNVSFWYSDLVRIEEHHNENEIMYANYFTTKVYLKDDIVFSLPHPKHYVEHMLRAQLKGEII